MPCKSAAMSDEKYQENLSYIADPEVRIAYAHMRKLATSSGFSIEFVERAAVGTMKLMKPELGREAYLFSVDRARRHLTFYVRCHATRRWPDLIEQPYMAAKCNAMTSRSISELRLAMKLSEYGVGSSHISKVFDRKFHAY